MLATEKRVAYEETRFEKVPALLILTMLEVLKDDSSGFCMAEYLEKTVLCKLYRLAGVKYNMRLPQISSSSDDSLDVFALAKKGQAASQQSVKCLSQSEKDV